MINWFFCAWGLLDRQSKLSEGSVGILDFIPQSGFRAQRGPVQSVNGVCRAERFDPAGTSIWQPVSI